MSTLEAISMTGIERNIVELHELTKRYGTHTALASLTLHISRGSVYGLLGPNGSGKTTTIGMILGFITPTAGSVRLFGSDGVAHLRAMRSRIGSSVETPAFYPFLTGRENLRVFQMLRSPSDRKSIDRLLDLVALSQAANQRFDTYSMGMRQRLAIARALLAPTDLVILDEPTNGLDPSGVSEVREVIRRLANDGQSIILCSHQLAEVELLCDAVAILDHGRLVAEGSVANLLHRRTAYSIRTTDDAAALQILEGLDWATRVPAGDVPILVELSEERVAELASRLGSASVYFTELVPRRRSLEQCFLDVTGRGTRSPAATDLSDA